MKNIFTRGFLVVPIIIIVIVSVYAYLVDATRDEPIYLVKNGVVNLENWDHSENKTIDLNGEWKYYAYLLKKDMNSEASWQIKSVPHFWEQDADQNRSPFGFGTYRLQITGLDPIHIYGLEIPDEVTSYKLSVNNVTAALNGVVGETRGAYTPRWRPVTGVFQADENGDAEFIMEIANFDYYRGGFWNSVRIGSIEDIFSDVNNSTLLDMFLFSSIFIFGFYNLILFFVHMRRDKTTLYFSLFCFCMSLRTLIVGQRLISDIIPGINWYILVRFEYLLGYLLVPLFGLFAIGLLQSLPYQTILKRILIAMLICFSVATLTLPNSVYTAFLLPYKWLSMIIIAGFTFFAIKGTKPKTFPSAMMFLVLAGFAAAIIKEVFVGGIVSWIPFATINLIICFSLMTFQNFFKLIRENEILGVRAIKDPLTGLYNRTYLMELGKTINIFEENNQRKYLLFLDLDSFKVINDSFGHKIGDYILREIGDRLKNLLRNMDSICRYGGDEFIIIIDGQTTDINDIKNIAEKIIRKIQEPFLKDGISYNLSVSIGIAEIDAETNGIDSVIKRSDDAMYEAKRNGGGQYYIWQG